MTAVRSPRKASRFTSTRPEQGFFIHSTHRMANGHIVWLSMTGTVRELSPEGKQVRQLELPQAKRR